MMASNADILAFQGGLKGASSDASPFKRPIALAAPPRAWLILIALAFALAWFGNIGYRKLVKADEGRYAEIPREMVASGDWLTPRLNGFKYFEKPALQYWATAAAFSVFGLHDWAARLWPALTGFLGVLLVWLIGNRAFGPPVGLAAAAVLASSGIYAFVGHFLTLDMGVSVFMSATVLFCMMGQRDGLSPRDERNWMLAAWAAAALAMLSKGLIGIVLPGAAFLAYVLLARDWRRLARLHWLPGLALFLLITAPWFVAVSLANKEFFHFFFIHEHFERFLTKQHGRYQPFWYFVPVLALGATPWLFSLAAGFFNACKGKAVYVAPEVKLSRVRSFNAERFLALWCAVVFLFFSASDSKLGSYILPLFPAVALLTALQLRRASCGGLALQAGFAMLLGAAACLLAPQLTRFAEPSLPAELLANYVPWVFAAGAALALGGAAAAWTAWRGLGLASLLLLAAGSLGFVQLAINGHESLSPLYSAYDVAQKIKPALRPDTPVYTVNTFDHTLPYYLGRTVTMVGYMDELTIAVGWEPEKFLPDLAAFQRRWMADRDAWAVFAPSDFAALAPALKSTMDVIAEDPRRVVVRKKAA